ncbi:hypothetical protein BGZ63DRAFT_395795 [Mariannaea sp. PMI_226]|nr:hypothetical protein BGZ63DRAFT_395795 [Mariannaea sp. PMI_226]
MGSFHCFFSLHGLFLSLSLCVWSASNQGHQSGRYGVLMSPISCPLSGFPPPSPVAMRYWFVKRGAIWMRRFRIGAIGAEPSWRDVVSMVMWWAVGYVASFAAQDVHHLQSSRSVK